MVRWYGAERNTGYKDAMTELTHQPVAIIHFHQPVAIKDKLVRDMCYCNVRNEDPIDTLLEAWEFARAFKVGSTVEIQ